MVSPPSPPSFAAHIKAADDKLLVSPELEDRLDLSAYRDTQGQVDRPIKAVLTGADNTVIVDGWLVKCQRGMPHQSDGDIRGKSFTFRARSSAAFRVYETVISDCCMTLTDGNTELVIKLMTGSHARTGVEIECVKDSTDVLITVMAW